MNKSGIIGTLLVIGVLAGCGTTAQQSASHSHKPYVGITENPAAQATPAPSPSPNGTYQGACDYNLGSNPAGGTAVATGDIQVANTGNIGTIVHLRITWPQQGYSPLAMTRTVRLTAGASRDVQFHRPLSYSQITNLQDWQLGHEGSDGCTYHGAMVGTFGGVR